MFSLGGFFLALTFSSVSAYEEYIENEGTYVFGVITENTTWIADHNPYIVVGDIIVPEGKTLTIEPGVEIKFDGYDYELEIEGTLKAIGNKDNYITFTSNQENSHNGSWRGIKLEKTSENNEIQYAIIEYASIGVAIDYNCENLVNIKNSIFSNLYQGISNCNGNVSYNDFINVDTAFSNSKNCAITNNYISESRNVFRYPGTETTIYLNNIVNHNPNNESDAWLVYWERSEDLDAENNYWGTADEDYINAHIYSRYDEAEVDYKPYADSLLTFNLTGPEDNVLLNEPNGVSFSWEQINGSGKDLSHYQLYIDNGLMLDSLAVTSCEYDISSFTDGYHSWYVKAVNNDGESFKSNNIFGFNKNIETPHTPIANPSGGWYFENQNIFLTAGASAIIRYTLDGSEPTDLSTEYSEPISIETTVVTPVVLKAKAWDGTENSSLVMTEIYYFDLIPPETPVADPVAGIYDNSVSVTLSVPITPIPFSVTTIAAAPVTITINSAQLNGNLFSLGTASSANVSFEWGTTTGYGDETSPTSITTAGSFDVILDGLTSGTTYHFRAKAVSDNNVVVYGLDKIFTTLTGDGGVAPGGGGGGGGMSHPVEIVEIRYTINGSDPTELSKKYTGSIQIYNSTVLKAKAWDGHGNSSGIMEQIYFIKNAEGYYPSPDYNANLQSSLEEGAYIDASGSIEIALSANEQTNIIRYTLDGEEVSEESTGYTGPITISAGTTVLKARAWAENGAVSYQTINNKYVIYDTGTYITENINSDVTWTLNNSPYIIQDYIHLANDNKLTIEPGVEIVLNKGFGIYGNIQAIGEKDNYIIFKSVDSADSVKYLEIGRNWNQKSNLEYVNFEHIIVSADNTNISHSIFDNAGGYGGYNFSDSKVNNNEFTINTWRTFNFRNNTVFSNNYIETKDPSNPFNSRYGLDRMFRIQGYDVVIRDNVFNLANLSDDIGDTNEAEAIFGIENNSYSIKIVNNNFDFDLPENIKIIKNESDMNIDVRNNYWGTTDENYIKSHIYDYYDNHTFGEAYYQPFADTDLTFDLVFPNNHIFNNSNINFQWEEIIGSGNDLSRYQLFIDDSKAADNILETNYNYPDSLGNGSHTWHVKAVNIDNSEIDSNQIFDFEIKDTLPYQIIAQPKGDAYIYPQEVSLIFPVEESIIRYTLDDTGPTENSLVYIEPIKIADKGLTILKAMAWYNEDQSPLLTEEYNIDIDPPEIVSAGYNVKENNSVDLVVELDRQGKPGKCRYVAETERIEIDNSNDCVEAGHCWGPNGCYNCNGPEPGEYHGFNFISADGTSFSLIAHLHYLNNGLYKYHVECTDGVDKSESFIKFTVGEIGPVAYPESEAYVDPQHIHLSAGSGASIYYTLDGNDPICGSGLVYEEPILVDENTTIKAMACYGDSDSSEVVSFEYTITGAAGEGIRVHSIYWIKNFGTTDNTYLNGWKVRFNVTIDNNEETNLWLKLADWKAGSVNTISTIGNTKISLTDLNTEDEIENAVNVGTEYDGNTPLIISDEDSSVGGIQQTFYVWIKLPQNTAAGTYSTTFGIETLEPQD